MSGDPSDLLKTSEVAEMLRCGLQKAQRMVGNEIPSTYDGYRWLTRRGDVNAWIDANTQEARNTKQRRRGRGRRAA